MFHYDIRSPGTQLSIITAMNTSDYYRIGFLFGIVVNHVIIFTLFQCTVRVPSFDFGSQWCALFVIHTFQCLKCSFTSYIRSKVTDKFSVQYRHLDKIVDLQRYHCILRRLVSLCWQEVKKVNQFVRECSIKFWLALDMSLCAVNYFMSTDRKNTSNFC